MVKQITNESEIPQVGLVVVDFFATWCGPCKRIAPAFVELAAEYTDVTFLKVDVDEATELAEQYGVNAMPTFLFIENGQVTMKIEGADLKAIQLALSTHRARSEARDMVCR